MAKETERDPRREYTAQNLKFQAQTNLATLVPAVF
ncbi:sister chromatid cohesion protein Mis4 [Aspergillus luchuensis]|uniref:Sister chromatid cohesion protein Mis4 n=1 Tax=Aspergillus kawachii TaxID=1069201 RepID=A0A146EZA1_ASPKA|nr:sister chromatid cohesion protein Mis4 [Aspergillus luchuensis]